MILLLLACGRQGPASAVPTWSEDVQPIVALHCDGCHVDGGLGGFSLTTYEQVSVIGSQVAESVASLRMPPFLAEPDSCEPLTKSRRLSEQERDTIGQWVLGGMPRGPEREPTPAPVLDLMQDATEIRYTPAFKPGLDAGDEWRCFVVEGESEQTQYIQAYSIVPEHKEIVHHVSIFAPADAQAAQEARELDEGQGYRCFGDAIVPAMLIAIGSPSQAIYRYPKGTGAEIDGGLPLIMQIHYSSYFAESQTERTALHLKLVDEVEWPILPLFFLNDEFELPPGQSDVDHSLTMSVDEAIRRMGVDAQLTQTSFRVFGASVHMHLMGSSVSARMPAQDRCLVDVKDWDYDWHDLYFYQEPFTLSREDEVELRCSWDTRTASETVIWGDEIEDEMCAVLLLVSPQ